MRVCGGAGAREGMLVLYLYALRHSWVPPRRRFAGGAGCHSHGGAQIRAGNHPMLPCIGAASRRATRQRGPGRQPPACPASALLRRLKQYLYIRNARRGNPWRGGSLVSSHASLMTGWRFDKNQKPRCGSRFSFPCQPCCLPIYGVGGLPSTWLGQIDGPSPRAVRATSSLVSAIYLATCLYHQEKRLEPCHLYRLRRRYLRKVFDGGPCVPA